MKSNILIIKHGSFGDLIQINGCLRDIRNNHPDANISLLTTPPYKKLMKQCPFLDEIIIDQRKPRWNLIYLNKLKSKLIKYNFQKVYDLQNSARTEFYRNNILKINNWSSSRSILNDNEKKEDFDKKSILERFSIQLERSGVKTEFTDTPQIEWMVDKNFESGLEENTYIVIFPFCSKKHPQKRWPYYKELIHIINEQSLQVDVVIIPGPGEISQARDFDAKLIMNHEEPTDFFQLAKILKESLFVISNDTGPAHLAAHLGCKGLSIFGSHTSPEKVSIITSNFQSITRADLSTLPAKEVFDKIHSQLQIDGINKVRR